MGFELEAPQELRDGRIDHEGIEDIDVVGYEDACALGVKARRPVNFQARACEAKNVAEEEALGPVVFSRVDEGRKNDEEEADHCEMNSADRP
jgi:hypothetical protein